MTVCWECWFPAVKGGLCGRHWVAQERIPGRLFMARLGEEMAARKVHEMPFGTLAWHLAGDAAWRAAIEPKPPVVIGPNGSNGCTMGDGSDAANAAPVVPTPEQTGASDAEP